MILWQLLLLEIGPAAPGLGPFAGRKPCERHGRLTTWLLIVVDFQRPGAARRRGVRFAMRSKSASAWSNDASALMATTAIKQSTNRRMVSPARRHVRYMAAASS